MKKFAIVITTLVLVVAVPSVPRAFGMPDTNTLIATCTGAQSILNQIQKTDTSSRNNRGNGYNEMSNLMSSMNARLSINKIAEPALTDLALQFDNNLAKFRRDYSSYSSALIETLNIRCTNDPLGFYGKLESTRTARKMVEQDVATLSQNINDYYAKFNTVIGESRQP